MVHSSGATKDQVTVVAAGVTLVEAMKAARALLAESVSIRVIDPFTIKPMDVGLLQQAVRETRDELITVEDHMAEGELRNDLLS